MLHDNNVTQFAVKHSSYTNATTGYLFEDLLTYYYVSAFTNTKPDPTHPIRYLEFHSVRMQFKIMPRIYVGQFILVHIAKCNRSKSWIMSSYFPMSGFMGNSMCIYRRQSTQLCPYQMHSQTQTLLVNAAYCFIKLISNSIIEIMISTNLKWC